MFYLIKQVYNSFIDNINTFIVYIYILIVVCIILIFFFKLRYASVKGFLGERFVSKNLKKLDSKYYKIIHNLLLPSKGNTQNAQIDHMVISNYGIFCIETKTHKGWIFGNARQKNWTQVYYHFKKRFYNPFWQNYAHTKAIEDLLKSQNFKVHVFSFVIFTHADKLKISNTDAVGCSRDVLDKIKRFNKKVYSDFERDEIFNLFQKTNILDKKMRKKHIKEVRKIKNYNKHI